MSGFEKVFRKIFNGVFVITTKKGDIVNGMTAAWVSRASFKPPCCPSRSARHDTVMTLSKTAVSLP